VIEFIELIEIIRKWLYKSFPESEFLPIGPTLSFEILIYHFHLPICNIAAIYQNIITIKCRHTNNFNHKIRIEDPQCFEKLSDIIKLILVSNFHAKE